jgi:Rrf2 family protein
MSLLPRKGVIAITAVIDVALNARNGPVNSKALAKRQHLGPRYLESELQALVREGILKAVRGPHGGYVLAREQRRITAADILRAARTVDDESEEPVSGSALIVGVVGPALAKGRTHSRTRTHASVLRTWHARPQHSDALRQQNDE